MLIEGKGGDNSRILPLSHNWIIKAQAPPICPYFSLHSLPLILKSRIIEAIIKENLGSISSESLKLGVNRVGLSWKPCSVPFLQWTVSFPCLLTAFLCTCLCPYFHKSRGIEIASQISVTSHFNQKSLFYPYTITDAQRSVIIFSVI